MTVGTELKQYHLLIDGKHVPAASGETFDTVNPANNQPIGRIAKAGVEDVNRAVAAARRAFEEGPWRTMTPMDRSRVIRRAAEIIRERTEELARIETENCGKIIVESRQDVINSANCLEYYANLTGQIWGETIPMNGPLLDYTTREPYGVCGQIIPWNFPMLMAAWKLGPALATGNTIVLKPASDRGLPRPQRRRLPFRGLAQRRRRRSDRLTHRASMHTMLVGQSTDRHALTMIIPYLLEQLHPRHLPAYAR